MASKVKKGFLYYLAWFAFICLGIVCIFATILIFNPGKDIFGINLCYISQNVEKKYNHLSESNINYKDLNLENIVVSTTISNVVITADSTLDQLTVKVESKVSGFAKYDTYQKYGISITHNGNTLNINVKESKMFLAFNNSSSIQIICPKTFNLSNTNFIFNTDSGRFSMGANKQFPSILKSLTINSKNSKVSLFEHSSFTSGNVTFNADSLNAVVHCNVSGNLNITSNSGSLTLYEITGNLNLTANSIKAKCGIIRGKVFYSCDDGYIDITLIGSPTSQGGFSSSQETEISNVRIRKIYGNVAIPNGHKSDIIVEDIEGKSVIKTTSGNVTIGKSNDEISVITTSGAVTFTQTNVNALTTINTTSGKITGNFTEVGTVNLSSEKGKVIVNVATDKPFTLNYETKKSIQVSFIEKALEKNGSLFIATEEANGKEMNIKTNNTIVINNGFELEEKAS